MAWCVRFVMVVMTLAFLAAPSHAQSKKSVAKCKQQGGCASETAPSSYRSTRSSSPRRGNNPDDAIADNLDPSGNFGDYPSWAAKALAPKLTH